MIVPLVRQRNIPVIRRIRSRPKLYPRRRRSRQTSHDKRQRRAENHTTQQARPRAPKERSITIRFCPTPFRLRSPLSLVSKQHSTAPSLRAPLAPLRLCVISSVRLHECASPQRLLQPRCNPLIYRTLQLIAAAHSEPNPPRITFLRRHSPKSHRIRFLSEKGRGVGQLNPKRKTAPGLTGAVEKGS